MGSLILKILNYILKLQEKKSESNNFVAQNLTSLSSAHSGSKSYINGSESLSITAKTDEDKKKLDKEVRKIIKKNIKTPEKLLEFIEKNETPVYKIKFADKILNIINETEGFIAPLKGFRALYLNLILNKKFKFETGAIFVLRNLPLNIYALSHQFHKWYGFKMNLSGFDDNAQELFRKIEEFSDVENIKKLNYSDIISLKEALKRDIEAIDFVINLSKENSGAKNALENIKGGKGANI